MCLEHPFVPFDCAVLTAGEWPFLAGLQALRQPEAGPGPAAWPTTRWCLRNVRKGRTGNDGMEVAKMETRRTHNVPPDGPCGVRRY